MTKMRERGTHCQYLAVAVAAMCPSNDQRNPLSWSVEGIPSREGFPP